LVRNLEYVDKCVSKFIISISVLEGNNRTVSCTPRLCCARF